MLESEEEQVLFCQQVGMYRCRDGPIAPHTRQRHRIGYFFVCLFVYFCRHNSHFSGAKKKVKSQRKRRQKWRQSKNIVHAAIALLMHRYTSRSTDLDSRTFGQSQRRAQSNQWGRRGNKRQKKKKGGAEEYLYHKRSRTKSSIQGSSLAPPSHS